MSIYGAAKNGLFTQEKYTSLRNKTAAEVGFEAGGATAETIAGFRARLEQLTVDISFANQIEDVIKNSIKNLQV